MAALFLGPLAWLWGKFSFYIVAAGVIAGAFMYAYTKGRRDRAALDARRQAEAVHNVQTKYSQIDARPDDLGYVLGRLRDGSF